MFHFSLLSSAKWYPVLFDTPLNAVRSVAIWLTLAVVIAFTVCALVIKGEKRAKFLKIGLISLIVYAAIVGIVLLALTFSEDGIVTILFVPILFLIVAIAASAVTLCFKRNKMIYIITGCAVGATVIATLVCMSVYFSTGDAAAANGITNKDVNQIGLYLCAVIFTIAVIAVAIIFDRHNKFQFNSKSIAYAAICIAMSFALSYLRIVKMPQGGSITIASLLPLMIYSFMFGTKKGVFAGSIYGLLQAIQDPYIIHPAQFILDYPAAFACIGLAGLFANCKPLENLPQVEFAIGGVIAGICRFIMHWISGTFAFGSFAPEGQPAWLYSLIYQSGYVLPDIAIAIAVGVIILCSPSIVRVVRKFNVSKPAAMEETATTQDTASEEK